jgi:hypothetical protein
MNIKQLVSKKKKINKLLHELRTADYSDAVGQKVKLTKKCIDWYKEHADTIGMPYEEMEVITSRKTVGVITKVRYDIEDEFTITVDFGTMDLRVGIEDIRIVK